jgi:NlpC/P60 family
VRGYPGWGPPPWGLPVRRGGPPLGLVLLAAVVLVFLFGWRLAPAAGRVWADLSTGHLQFNLQLPKVTLPQLPLPKLEPPPAAAGGGSRAAVAYAKAQLGKPYLWGANGPGSFDCSGLTFRAWQAQLGWGHMTAAGQYAWLRARGAAGQLGALQPGDLVFYRHEDGAIGHVAIVSGPGVMIEAPGQGEQIHQVPVRGGYLAARPSKAGRR